MIVTQLALNMSLQLLDHQLGVGQRVRAARATRLTHFVGVVGLQQTLKDIAACTPLAMRHIVALGRGLAVLAGRAHVVVVGRAGLALAARLHRAGTFRAQRIDGAVLQILGYA